MGARRPRAGSDERRTSLLWQAALIVLPVAVLSGAALYSVRQDRASIDREARERAQALAPDLARAAGSIASQFIGRATPQLAGEIVRGRVASPPGYDLLPEPPEWLDQLTGAQARLRAAAETAANRPGDRAAARKAWTAFLASGPPAAARADAQLRILALDEGARESPALAGQALDLARRPAGLVTETGAPVADIALLLALQQAGSGRWPDGLAAALRRAALEHPSFLTVELLEAADHAALDAETRRQVGAIQAAWSGQETTRALLRALPVAGPDVQWLEADGQPFLALSTQTPEGVRVILAPGKTVEEAFRDGVRDSPLKAPAWAASVIDIGGRRMGVAQARPLGVLAIAGGAILAGSPHPFTLSLELSNPDLLYAGYRRRLWITTGLILCATAAAMLGLAGLWRSFRRQARLAEMKSNFVSSVSHELRAPIGAVRLMAESLESGRVEGDAKRQEYFSLIAQECRRLSTLVENVLDFSRIEQGRKHYNFEPVDVAALVRQAAALMAPHAAERNVRIETPGGGVLEARWDHQAIEQALVNLLDNAIKHSPEGGTVTLAIEVSQPGRPADVVRIRVEDRGEGIPPEAHARIFDLFYRHGAELRRETKGVGIGLSIVKHVAEAHGGRVTVESAVGQGSRFGLELPLEPPPAREAN